MKTQILVAGLLFFPIFCYSQPSVDSLVQVGINYHDSGQYESAIKTYKSALDIEPNSALVNYELAFTYMTSKNYEKCIKHSDKVIKLDQDYLLPSYITKGSCLDYIGKIEKSILLFKNGLNRFGDHHLLFYNLGFNYYQLKDYENAKEAFINAINTNSDHSSSHLLLGYVMAESNHRVQSLLSLYYFLLLEPNSGRSESAYNSLRNQFRGNVERDEKKPNQLNVFVDPNQSETEFGAAEIMISMLEASNNLEEDKGKSEEEIFINNTTSLFNVLGELKEKHNHEGLWWDFYISFFYKLAKSEHIDTFCYYISYSSNKKAQDWLNNNIEKVEKFNTWLNDH